MEPTQRSLAHSILLIGTFMLLGLVFIDTLIGDPTAFT